MRMIRQQESFEHESKMDKICGFRAKFNVALNEHAANIDQRMLTINSCRSIDQFDKWGNISERGAHAIWDELDSLIERFLKNDIKLLPAPRQKIRKMSVGHQTEDTARRHNHNHNLEDWSSRANHRNHGLTSDGGDRRYPLPRPPPRTFNRFSKYY